MRSPSATVCSGDRQQTDDRPEIPDTYTLTDAALVETLQAKLSDYLDQFSI